MKYLSIFFAYFITAFSLAFADNLNTSQYLMKCDKKDWVVGKLIDQGNLKLENGKELYMTVIASNDNLPAIPLFVDPTTIGKYVVVRGKLSGDLYNAEMLKVSDTPIDLEKLTCHIDTLLNNKQLD